MADELILNELEAKSRILDEYRTRLENLRSENQNLLVQLETKERDSMAVIKYLRQENDTLQEQLRVQKEEMEIAKTKAEETVFAANEARDAAIAAKEQEFEDTNKDRDDELRRLRDDNVALGKFRDRKVEMEQELEKLKQDLKDAEERHSQTMIAVERKLVEEKSRLQREAHAQLMEIKRNTDEEVVNRLDVSTKRILQQNRRLAEDLRLHVQQLAEVQKAKTRLEEDNKRLRRDLELNTQQMQIYAEDREKASKQVAALQSKVKTLESSMGQVVSDFEKERERLVAKGKADIADTETENAGLRKLMKVKEREHAKMKKLAQDIVSQRSEVEQFFLEALDQVRDEVLKEKTRAATAKTIPDGTFITSESSTHFQARLPQIRGNSRGNTPGASGTTPAAEPAPIPAKVDIRDLSWEDKERVLRLLFAKINQSQGAAAAAAAAAAATTAMTLTGVGGQDRQDQTAAAPVSEVPHIPPIPPTEGFPRAGSRRPSNQSGGSSGSSSGGGSGRVHPSGLPSGLPSGPSILGYSSLKQPTLA